MTTLNITREQFITEWLAALRSGQYLQAQEALRTDEGFCCLGVACDIASKHGGPQWTDHPSYGREYDGEEGSLPGWLAEWLAKSRDHGESLFTRLAKLNDNGSKFPELADIIEKELT